MANLNARIKSTENINNVKVKATTSGEVGEITAKNDTGIYYSNLAKQWATKMDGLVVNEDYSAKYYANQAKSAETNALNASAAAASSVAELDNNYETYSEELSDQTNNALSQIEQKTENYLSQHSIKKEVHVRPEISVSDDGYYYWTIQHSLGTANIDAKLMRVSDGAVLWGNPVSITETTVIYKTKANIQPGTIKAVLMG